MASVASLVRGSDLYMNFIDYQGTYKDDNKEFLRGDMWEFTLTNPPKIVYYPGDQIFKARLQQVNLGIDTSVSGFEKRMRGNYVIFQRTGQQTSGQITLQFEDKEDQAITYFCDDWRQKIADRDTKYSFRKDDVVADCKMILTNSSRKTVRTINFFNCIIDDAPLDMNGVAEDGTDRADIQVQLSFEHYKREFLNL
jgi:hypothetical protein